MKQVKQGKMTVRQASQIYDIPKMMISDHVTGKRVCSRHGPEPYLSKQLEDRIASWLIKMARIGYGQTKEQLFVKIQELVNYLQIRTPFLNNRPSEMWYRLFMACYPELSRKQPSLLSRQRAGITRQAIDEWFEEYKSYLEEIGHGYLLDQPSRIFNADETGFPLAPKPLKVIAAKGEPHVYQQGSSSKTQITTLLCHNAAGQFINPMLVFPGKAFRHDFMDRFYQHNLNAVFGRSSNGWMDADLFKTWIENVFHPYLIKKHLLRPVILIIDGAKVHISYKISVFCDENQIILYVSLRLRMQNAVPAQPCVGKY